VRRARLRGLETAWREAGPENAPVLLCLHGYPDSPAVWEAQEQAFADRYRVVAPYARGASPSEPADDLGRYGRDAVALDCLGILEQVDPTGTREVVLMAHDLGVVQACHLAPLLGARLRAVILFNGLSLPMMVRRLRRPGQVLRSWYIWAILAPGRVVDRLTSRFPRTALHLVRRLADAPPASDEEKAAAPAALTAPLAQYRALARELWRASRERAPRVTAPVLVLWGTHDPFLLPPTENEWATFGSDVTIRFLEGGHWLFKEKPVAVNAICREFLDSPRGAATVPAPLALPEARS
jgi:pimeloyl-ACP methyl ester carboxylesterase